MGTPPQGPRARAPAPLPARRAGRGQARAAPRRVLVAASRRSRGARVRRGARARHQDARGEDRRADLAVRGELGARAHGGGRPQHPPPGHLRAAVGGPRCPPKVAINEALEVAKKFSTQESSRFINGILDRVHKEHRPPAVLTDQARHPLRRPLRRPRQSRSPHRRARRRRRRRRARDALPGRPGGLRRRSRSPAWRRWASGRARCVAGNHEHGALGLLDLDWFNPRGARGRACGRATQLDADHRGLPRPRCRSARRSRRRPCVHASPRSPEEWDYLVSEEDGLEVFGDFDTRLCFVGHSHLAGGVVAGLERARITSWPARPADGRSVRLDDGRRYLVNVGSVGQPRDRDPRAALRALGPRGAHGDHPARRLRLTRPRRRRSSPRACRARWPIGSRVESEPAARCSSARRLRARRPRRCRACWAPSPSPTTDWSLLAWIWLVPALVLRARTRAARAPSRTAGSPAPSSTSSSCAGSITRSCTTARSRGRSPGCPSSRSPRTAASTSALVAAAVAWLRDRARRRARRSASRPRCGWRGSGCAASSWAASPGACSATPSTRSLPVIQIAELGGVYARVAS